MYGSPSTHALLPYICLLFSGFSNVYHFACVWPTALKRGWVTNYLDPLFFVMGFISLVDEVPFMLISSRHICIRSIDFLWCSKPFGSVLVPAGYFSCRKYWVVSCEVVSCTRVRFVSSEGTLSREWKGRQRDRQWKSKDKNIIFFPLYVCLCVCFCCDRLKDPKGGLSPSSNSSLTRGTNSMCTAPHQKAIIQKRGEI